MSSMMGISTTSLTDLHSQQKQQHQRLVEVRCLSQWKSCLESSRRSNKLLVVDFTAAWCRPCRFMEPALGEFAAKYPDIEFIKIDVDRLPSVAKEFAVQIMPMVAVVKGGKEVVDKVEGVKKTELQGKIEKHRAQFSCCH